MLTNLLLALQLVADVVGFTVLVRVLRRTVREAESQTQELRDLRLKSRTRIGTASIRNGVEKEERTLVRLGRASAGKRKVVGGEPGSELHERLERGSVRGQG